MNRVVLEFPRGRDIHLIIVANCEVQVPEVVAASPLTVRLSEDHIVQEISPLDSPDATRIEAMDEDETKEEENKEDSNDTVDLVSSDEEEERKPKEETEGDDDEDEDDDDEGNDLVFISQIRL